MEEDTPRGHRADTPSGRTRRTENTFSAGEGCFVVNRSGAVRGIRSYMGANSGPLTQREHLFYERRHDIRTFLRVHLISGMVDYFDYSPAAIGTTYRNDRSTGGVTIDGAPDTVLAGALAWELVEGGLGRLIIVHDLETDIPGASPTSYYLDSNATPPPVRQCTGDPWVYGASGPWFNATIPCTDPVACAQGFGRFSVTRTPYYEAPGATAADAAARAQCRDTPLGITVAAWPPPSPLAVRADPSQGTPLTVRVNPSDPQALDLSWGESCGAAVTAGCAVHEGILGSPGSHLPIDCLAPGTGVTIPIPSGDRYYLVVPVSSEVEGSYGTDSQGNERPVSATESSSRLLPSSAGAAGEESVNASARSVSTGASR